MNVIIRLQNLPWSASATDIRQFFRNLQIPDGGVHIVGGEDGDAFIAFSTDEDARQAMSMNRMKLKDTPVTLLLSSRAEMQKVIEKARAASGFANKTSLPTPEAITNQFVTKKIAPDISAQSSSSLITNFLQMQQQQQQNQLISSSATNGITIPGLGGGTNAMYYNQVDYMKLINAATPQQQQQQQFPVSRDPREQARYLQQQQLQNHRGHLSNGSRRERSRSPYSSENDEKKERRRRTRFSSPEKKAVSLAPVIATNNAAVTAVISSNTPQMTLIQQQQQQFLQQQQNQVAYSTNQQLLKQHQAPQLQIPAVAAYSSNQQQMVKNGIWDIPPPVNLNSYSSYNQQQLQVQATRNYQTVDSTSSSSSSSKALGGIGTCVKIANVDKDTTYGDIRKFFGGLAIGNNDIKFVTDSSGHPTGVAVVRFLSSDSKKQALTKNGWQLKSTQIFISSISEEDYESGLEGRSRGLSTGNNTKGRYEDTRRHRDRSDSRERERDRDRDRDRYGGNNNNNRNNNYRSYGRDNGYNNRGSHQNGNNYRNNFRRDNNNHNDDHKDGRNYQRDDFNSQQTQQQQTTPKIEYTPDENYHVLIIDDIPRVNENEIIEAFPTIASLTIERYTAHCRFNSHEEAKSVLENRFSHFINKKRVFIEKGSEAQFNDLVRKFGKFDNPSMKSNGNNVNEESLRDPRQRPSQNGNFKTDCIMIKRMDKSSTIEDVEAFLGEAEIPKNQIRIHILLDRRGQPAGDCFVEFQFPDDIEKALTKNNQFIKQNRVDVMPIPREQVDAILGSFGNDNQPQQQQQQRRDWGPPPDFGSPDCVVMISNLSYRAVTDDIIDAFREFDLTSDQVIRRFNDNGQPTGMACINFNSPDDATKACDEYNKILIQNRPIWLKRVL